MAEVKKGLIGKKVRMTQLFTEDGEVVPLTAIAAGPCIVTQIREMEKDGYSAVQLAFEPIKEQKLSKPRAGHFLKSNLLPHRFLKEFRVSSVQGYSLGQQLTVGQFEEGESVDVTAVSKGRGFMGVVKRYGFKGGSDGHGSMFHRGPGSIGASAYPSRVMKGKRLPGRMGGKRVTVRNLKVIRVDTESNLIFVKGSVPGPNGGLVLIREVARQEETHD